MLTGGGSKVGVFAGIPVSRVRLQRHDPSRDEILERVRPAEVLDSEINRHRAIDGRPIGRDRDHDGDDGGGHPADDEDVGERVEDDLVEGDVVAEGRGDEDGLGDGDGPVRAVDAHRQLVAVGRDRSHREVQGPRQAVVVGQIEDTHALLDRERRGLGAHGGQAGQGSTVDGHGELEEAGGRVVDVPVVVVEGPGRAGDEVRPRVDGPAIVDPVGLVLDTGEGAEAEDRRAQNRDPLHRSLLRETRYQTEAAHTSASAMGMMMLSTGTSRADGASSGHDVSFHLD